MENAEATSCTGSVAIGKSMHYQAAIDFKVKCACHLLTVLTNQHNTSLHIIRLSHRNAVVCCDTYGSLHIVDTQWN